jgi:hypothetical protein
MFCWSCACEMPATAKFCGRCGAHIEHPVNPAMTRTELQPAVHVPGVTSVILPKPPMFCGNCGNQHVDAADQFCKYCGHQTSSGTFQHPLAKPPNKYVYGMSVTAESGIDTTLPTIAGTQPASFAREAPPYAMFVSQVLGFTICGCVVVFNIANDSARGYWRSTLSTAVASILAMVLSPLALNCWKRITILPDNEANHRRKILTRSVVFALLFLTTAAIVGNAIGSSGKEAVQMASDSREMSQIGDRISQARSAVTQTIPSHLEMYKSIETDVQKFDTTLRRLQTDLAVYDGKFPNQRDETAKSIHAIEIGLKRAGLLKQEIAAAREIESLDPTLQWSAWQTKMQPLLDAERTLDNVK